MITNEDIIYNHILYDYEYLDWTKYNCDIQKYGDNYIYEIFKELNCDRYNKYGQQLMSITHNEYSILLNNAIRVLDKIRNYISYNNLFDTLVSIHERNILICQEYASKPKQTETKTKKKTVKVKNEFVKSVSTDMFTGKTNYIYSNLKTGEEIISDNPNLLEELNKPKEKKKKTVKVLSLPIGFSFKINK